MLPPPVRSLLLDIQRPVGRHHHFKLCTKHLNHIDIDLDLYVKRCFGSRAETGGSFMKADSHADALRSQNVTKVKQHSARGLPIVHHHKYVCEFPLKHRFCMRKFHAVMGHLKRDGVISARQIVEPDAVSSADCGLVHDPSYIHRFFNGETTNQEQKMTGFEWSPGIVSRCRYETGGTILACQLALERGIACSTGGGTHHAFAGHGSGYCLINDMAIAAATVIDRRMVDRVLLVDLDVHQGDGSASILSKRSDIFTSSVHCQSNFPFNKQMSDVDVGLNDHVQDEAYLKEIQECVPWVVDLFRPDLVIFDAGIDPHVDDELGRLNLTDSGLFQRDYFVIDFLMQRGIPVATVIGGGYSRNLQTLGKRHTIVHRAASKVWFERNM